MPVSLTAETETAVISHVCVTLAKTDRSCHSQDLADSSDGI
jgi:hypothetical protein